MSFTVYWPILLSIGIILLLRSYDATLSNYMSALWEAVVTWIVSNSPMIFLVLYYIHNSPDAGFNYSTLTSTVSKNFQYGEVIIYVSALLAPVIYLFMSSFKEAHKAWHTLYFLMILICMSVSVLIFIEYKSNEIHNFTNTTLTALSLYSTSLILWIGSLVYQRAIQSGNHLKPTNHADSILKKMRGITNE